MATRTTQRHIASRAAIAKTLASEMAWDGRDELVQITLAGRGFETGRVARRAR